MSGAKCRSLVPIIGVAFHAHRLEMRMSQEPLSPLHLPSEEPGGVALQGARCFPSCADGRNHNETYAGCIVSWTTPSKCSRNCVSSTSLRSVALKASNVLTASYLRR